MTDKTEALRLAGRLDLWGDQGDLLEAAAELRRLSIENEAQQGAIAQFHHAVAGAGWHPGRTDDLLTDIIRDKGQELRRLHAQRDALLEACRAMLTFIERHAPRGLQPEPGSPVAKARAAIKAVE